MEQIPARLLAPSYYIALICEEESVVPVTGTDPELRGMSQLLAYLGAFLMTFHFLFSFFFICPIKLQDFV